MDTRISYAIEYRHRPIEVVAADWMAEWRFSDPDAIRLTKARTRFAGSWDLGTRRIVGREVVSERFKL